MKLTLVSAAVLLACTTQILALPSGHDLQARGTTAIGKACTNSPSCADGLFCNQKKCDVKADDSKACYKDVGCKSGTCLNSVCLGASSRPLSAPCTASTQCQSAYCGNSKCANKAPDGQACYKDVGCTSGKCVDKKCQATGTTPTDPGAATGAACTASTQCASGLCEYSKCAVKHVDGEGCYKDVACTSGKCVNGKCRAATLPSGSALGTACKASTQCASGLCENSKCATKKANGGSCYKDVACVSGYCKNGKKCAANPNPTATATAVATSTVTAVVNPVLANPEFTSLDGVQITGNGEVTIVNDADQCYLGNTCVKAVVPSGGSVVITQPVNSAGARRALLAGLAKRQGTTYVSNYWYMTTAFSPPVQYQPNSGVPSTPICQVRTYLNGITEFGNSILDVDTEWGSAGGATDDLVLTSIGVGVRCEAGAQATVLVDSMSFLSPSAYASSEAAGLHPTGFASRTSPPATFTDGVQTNVPTAPDV